MKVEQAVKVVSRENRVLVVIAELRAKMEPVAKMVLREPRGKMERVV